MADLFAGCDNSEEENEDKLEINSAYAQRYDEWRRKEELMKAKARFGSDLEASSDEDSSEAESEDEEAKYVENIAYLNNYNINRNCMGYMKYLFDSIFSVYNFSLASGHRNMRSGFCQR